MMTPRGRPPIGSQISVSFPPDLLARVDAAAKAAGVSRSEWLRRAAEGWLDRGKP